MLNAALEVLIGMAFVYLLLSIISSAVTETIARFFALRARTLEISIWNLLGRGGVTAMSVPREGLTGFIGRGGTNTSDARQDANRAQQSGKNARTPDARADATDVAVPLARQLYDHPLVESLYRKGMIDWLLRRSGKPSYIPSSTFALTLLDLLQLGPPPESGLPSASPTATAQRVLDIPDPEEYRRHMTAALDDARHKGYLTAEAWRALYVLTVTNAKGLDQARKNLEGWFDQAMERVSGWYARKARLIVFLCGIVIAVGMNVDSLIVAETLWRDPSLREAVNVAAQQSVDATATASAAQAAQATATPEAHGTPAAQPTAGASATPTVAPGQRIREANQALNALQLPIGWSDDELDLRRTPDDLGGWLKRGAGWLLTAVALTQGAPFWFDLLNKLVNIRAAGKPAEPKQEDSD